METEVIICSTKEIKPVHTRTNSSNNTNGNLGPHNSCHKEYPFFKSNGQTKNENL